MTKKRDDRIAPVRKGVTGAEVTSSGGTLIALEILLLSLIIPLFLWRFLDWNFFLWFIILFVGLGFTVVNGIYFYIGYLVSVLWGGLLFFLAYWVIGESGGEMWAKILGGSIAGLIAFRVTVIGRGFGQRYYKDVQDNYEQDD